jgi:hypothetical protein
MLCLAIGISWPFERAKTAIRAGVEGSSGERDFARPGASRAFRGYNISEDEILPRATYTIGLLAGRAAAVSHYSQTTLTSRAIYGINVQIVFLTATRR